MTHMKKKHNMRGSKINKQSHQSLSQLLQSLSFYFRSNLAKLQLFSEALARDRELTERRCCHNPSPA